MRLVLASASSRRLKLLNRIGYTPDRVVPAAIDEMPRKCEIPRSFALRMAIEKAHAVAIDNGEIVLGADTVVAVGRRIIGKPDDEAQAESFLKLLSGRRHRVFTAVAVRNHDQMKSRLVESTVRMKRLSQEELATYLQSREWLGKAGGYGIQGLAEQFIPWIGGSYSGIMGLPLHETRNLLISFGLKPKALHEG